MKEISVLQDELQSIRAEADNKNANWPVWPSTDDNNSQDPAPTVAVAADSAVLVSKIATEK